MDSEEIQSTGPIEKTSGVLQFLPQGGGFLRDPAFSFLPGREDAWVSVQLMRAFGLVEGAFVEGLKEQNERGWQLVSVESVCGLTPEAFQARTRFDKLQSIHPDDRIHLGETSVRSMRIIDLVAPIGKGTRGMIVSPPKAGKTTILEQLANAIYELEPDTRIIVLLIDERPEEVTQFRRNVKAEVLASSSDQSVDAHVILVETTMAQVRCELECGRNVVILMDSITRMARAFNQVGSLDSGRTLSGGLDSRAMEIPRKFFGLARNAEFGGSVTVLATALVDTGSRMDDIIFEEFKGTGNCEIVLDRSLADARIFPAINVKKSGTRREDLLYSKPELSYVTEMHRKLADMSPKDAMQSLQSLIRRAETNSELVSMGKVEF